MLFSQAWWTFCEAWKGAMRSSLSCSKSPFLGFPRMLGAAENLDRVFPVERNGGGLRQISSAESNEWFENGLSLCKRVYGEKYDSLFGKVAAMAPEVFRWMIIEGYGKVLSRPSLDIVSRELSIVAVKLDPGAESYFVLSWACAKSGQRNDALSAIQQALRLDPENATYRQLQEAIQKQPQ